MMNQSQMLSVVVDEASRDDVIDLLMTMDDISGFTLSTVNGFSREHSQYDIAEQVAGYRQLFRIDILHDVHQCEGLLTGMRDLKAASSIRYWVTPVIETGKL